MKERRIEIIDSVLNPKLKEINKTFASKDFLKKEDINEMAEIIEGVINAKIGNQKHTPEETQIIIDGVLSARTMLSYYSKFGGFTLKNRDTFIDTDEAIFAWKDESGAEHTDTITIAELEPFLQQIRLAVLEKINKKGVARNIQMVKRHPKEDSILFQLENDAFLKIKGEKVFAEKENTNQIDAFKYLYTLPEKSPFVYYGADILDPKTGRTISRPLKLGNILELIKAEKKPPLTRTLNYLLDTIKGHRFLLSKGLLLFDNHPQNMGINQETDTGILFDFDGLRKKGDYTTYRVPPHYRAPELPKEPGANAPITEASIIYEIGKTLGMIITYYVRKPEYASIVSGLKVIEKEMVEKTPEKRLTLAQVEEKLEKIINLG